MPTGRTAWWPPPWGSRCAVPARSDAGRPAPSDRQAGSTIWRQSGTPHPCTMRLISRARSPAGPAGQAPVCRTGGRCRRSETRGDCGLNWRAGGRRISPVRMRLWAKRAWVAEIRRRRRRGKSRNPSRRQAGWRRGGGIGHAGAACRGRARWISAPMGVSRWWLCIRRIKGQPSSAQYALQVGQTPLDICIPTLL